MKPQLISFKLCPFVQRSVIILLEKGIDFDITYIDIKEPPEWFLAISPFGKVPVLKIGDSVLFESAAINEYLDETHPPSMHPADPLRRAHNRAWIEYASNLNMQLHGVMMEKDADKWAAKCKETKEALARVEQQLSHGVLFNGEDFSLADAAFAPALMRAQLMDEHYGLDLLADVPRVRDWYAAMAKRDSVQRSVVPEFSQLFFEYIAKGEGCLAQKA